MNPLPTLWCPSLGAWVQVVARQRLLGHDIAQVLAPNGVLRSVPASTLASPEEINADALWLAARPLLARARLWEALSSDVPVAPLLSRVIPLPHQFRILRQALKRHETEGSPVRLLLADEVGLGKTVSAGLIQQELKVRGLIKRTLVVAPKSLLLQWSSEMDVHFAEWFVVVEPGSLTASQWENGWTSFPQAIVSLDSVKPMSNRAGWSNERIDRYNLARFHDLVGAGWDLVIIDEAHKVAGSTDDVSRHELARALSRVTPHLLLLSATPHSGHSEAFARLLSLLDPNRFGPGIPLDKKQLRSWMLRTDKRTALDTEGKPLFAPRQTQLLVVPFQPHHEPQRQLYEAISEYVLENYGVAGKTQGSRLLLILLQRLASSSTWAILRFLEKRQETLLAARTSGQATEIQELTLALEPESSTTGLSSDDWIEEEESEAQANVLVRISGSDVEETQREVEAVKSLLELARATSASGPDARAEALLETMLQVAARDSEPDKKFLIFTEWTATQEMLREFLTLRGFSVVLLNGSMSIVERKVAQETFRSMVQVLISTDAGGEGLNLQFAHVVFNYDLPWNPMRLEQRIGRVDRIGQKKPVLAFNLALENSVEARLYEVLSEKLTRILEEFGVDKTSDVLDSREANLTFDSLAKAALLNPQTFESQADQMLVVVRRAAEEGRHIRQLVEPLPAEDDAPIFPVLSWLDTAGLRDENDTTSLGQHLISLSPAFSPGVPVPALKIDVGFGIEGWFGLWKIGVTFPVAAASQPSMQPSRLLSICVNDAGRSFSRSARQIWDALSDSNTLVDVGETCDSYPFDELNTLAETEAERIFVTLRSKVEEQAKWHKETLGTRYLALQLALREIHSPLLRASREDALRSDFQKRLKESATVEEVLPIFDCLFLCRITCH